MIDKLPVSGPPAMLLVPPSPPGAPHVGTIYTWCLADAIRRTITTLHGRHAATPQSWNLASRRLEARYGDDPVGYAEHCETSIYDTIRTAARFGIEFAPDIAIRDDVSATRHHVQATIEQLAQRSEIRPMTVEEKWCPGCQIALPQESSVQQCFQCAASLRSRVTTDWFLPLVSDSIRHRSAVTWWTPPHSADRFTDLLRKRPPLRVGHPSRRLGISSPLHSSHILDPRLVAALGPTMLTHLGNPGPVIAVAGLDIQRKWLLPMFAANTPDALPVAVTNHGALLDKSGHKQSRYTGASLHDLPRTIDPPVIRAALLTVTLGRDARLSDLPIVAASRLRRRVINALRFLRLHSASSSPHAVDLDTELAPSLDAVENHLTALDTARAFTRFRDAMTGRLSRYLIPHIRTDGVAPPDVTMYRIRLLYQVIFGEDPPEELP